MPTSAEEAAAAKAAIAIVKLAKKYGLLDRLIDLFKTKHKILILGSTGVGKSQFVLSLEHLVPPTIDHMKRTQFTSAHRIHLSREVFDFIDTPGHDTHRERRINAIIEMLASGSPTFGVINVVSWGFHEYVTGKASALTSSKRPNSQWLENHRKIEIGALAEWVQLMIGRPSYVLTLVAKADLWWPGRDDVMTYYESGTYYETIKEAASKGHSVIPYSSVHHPFYGDGIGAGLFSDENRANCQQRFLEELFLLVAKSG